MAITSKKHWSMRIKGAAGPVRFQGGRHAGYSCKGAGLV